MNECTFKYTISTSMWRRQWQPSPVILPGKSHGQRSLVGYSPWGRKESDTTQRLHFRVSLVAKRLKHLPASARNAGELGSIPGLGRCPGEGNGNSLQYSCLGNPMDRGALQATNSPWGHERVGHNLATAAAAARVVMDAKRGAPRGPRISITLITALSVGFPDGLAVKNPPANAGDTGSTPGPEDSICRRGTKPMHCN